MEKFGGNNCFEMSEYSVQTADDSNKLISKACKATFVLCCFKLVLNLDTTTISNQIKYYFTKTEEIFWGCRYTLLSDFLWVVERAFTKNSRKAGLWLFGASLWKIIKALWLVKFSGKLIFIERRSWNSECPGLWYTLVSELTS